MLTNVAGKMVDSDFLLPVYERAQELGVPIFIHPTTPLGAQVMQEWRLAIILGFEFDIVLSATRLAYSGILDKFPELELRDLPSRRRHSLSRRQNRPRLSRPDLRHQDQKPTSEYLRDLYCDTVSFYQPALMMAYEFYGAGSMVLGSDFPLIIGDLPGRRAEHRGDADPKREKEKILGENVIQLLKLKV